MKGNSLFCRQFGNRILLCKNIATLLQLAAQRIFVLVAKSLSWGTEGHNSLSHVTVDKPLNLSGKHLTTDKVFHFSVLSAEIYMLQDQFSSITWPCSTQHIESSKCSVSEAIVKQLTPLQRLICAIKLCNNGSYVSDDDDGDAMNMWSAKLDLNQHCISRYFHIWGETRYLEPTFLVWSTTKEIRSCYLQFKHGFQ